jgi:hypothetical protein
MSAVLPPPARRREVIRTLEREMGPILDELGLADVDRIDELIEWAFRGGIKMGVAAANQMLVEHGLVLPSPEFVD